MQWILRAVFCYLRIYFWTMDSVSMLFFVEIIIFIVS